MPGAVLFLAGSRSTSARRRSRADAASAIGKATWWRAARAAASSPRWSSARAGISWREGLPASSKHADPAAAALAALLAVLPQAWRRTLTLDNGKEFARFKTVEEATGISVYFADPYAAWQRGANENSNGLLRQYLPKGIDMSKISDATLANAIDRINNRPRKCLGYRTPSEILQAKIGGALGC